jgi:hypothetical protein
LRLSGNKPSPEREMNMSQVCNTFLPVPNKELLAAKDSAVQSGVYYGYLASSEMYLMAAHLEQRNPSRLSLVHLRACAKHLSTSVASYRQALEIVKDSQPTKESLHWAAEFDYDRFFETRLSEGRMPNRADLWKRIAERTRSGKGVLSVIEFCEGLELLQNDIVKVLGTEDFSQSPTYQIQNWLGRFAELSTFGLMVGIMNEIRPLDPNWTLPVKILVQGSSETTQEVRA